MAFLSGLEIGDRNEDLMAMQLMVDLLTGQLGDEGQQSATANIVRVVIAGNSLSQETQGKDQLSKVRWLKVTSDQLKILLQFIFFARLLESFCEKSILTTKYAQFYKNNSANHLNCSCVAHLNINEPDP